MLHFYADFIKSKHHTLLFAPFLPFQAQSRQRHDPNTMPFVQQNGLSTVQQNVVLA